MVEDSCESELILSLFRTSIRNKLIAFLLAAVIVPLSTSIFLTYWYTKRTITQERIGVTSALLVQGRENIRHYMDTIHQTTLAVYNDAKLNANIETGATDYLSDKETYRALMHMANVMPDIYQVYLYVELAKQPYLMINALLKRVPESAQTFRPELGKAEVAVQPPHRSHDYGFAPTAYIEPATVMTMHRSIRRVPLTEELGILSVDINMQGLRAMAESLYDTKREQLYILDSSGYVIYGPDEKLWGNRPEEGWVSDLLARPEQVGSVFWDGDGFKGVQVYDKLKTNYLDWTIVKRIPDEVLYKQARDLTRINTFVLAAFSLLSIVVTVGVAFLFTAPIKRLIGYIGAIQKGNMNVDIDMKRKDEFGLLAARFRSMMQHINNLIVKEYRLELANRTNQLKALQAQINPHFLYNALQSIGTLALQMNAPNIYKLISSLGKMMRYSMNTAETSVPLAKEIDHIRSYVELQRSRFDEKVALTLELDEGTLYAELPKMTLQPIVENYFKHGFDPASGTEGAVVIRSGFTEDGLITISVEDNGKGPGPDRLNEMRQLLRRAGKGIDTESEEADGGGIGLLNVLSRLKLFYGNKADMHIEETKPHGFKVTMTIPAEGKEAQDESTNRG
ncbi:sensor histidine kinase [Paenibacillus mesophilus]|uniref:cache domain-containing sensor histidine kinase n=1 Tax=Paenibacillus mesophilus TaxID=2582849 RepID=UPI00110DB60F|nr:sensor histidine kinase [Paenibacillus mesophilus]TMV47531.1 sensor histidine kinase [Paenibacillus mesophilus]